MSPVLTVTRPPAPPTGRVAAPVLAEAHARGWYWCPRCRGWKPLDGFAGDRSRKHGLKTSCRACDNAAAAKRYLSSKSVA